MTERLPVVRESLLAGASVQLRNMATTGGNLLQRTRCRYFRDPTVACNKRTPGAGCSALAGHHRMHAILGFSEHCIATHGSDLAVALVALDAVVQVQGRAGQRRIQLTDLYVLPGDCPDVETVLEHGDLITAVEVPLPPAGVRSHYLKVRDRASYELALASAAIALDLDEHGRIREGRVALGGVALGGVATMPWRAPAAETILRDAPADEGTFRAAARAALPRRDNAFKVELAERTIVRALTTAAGHPEA